MEIGDILYVRWVVSCRDQIGQFGIHYRVSTKGGAGATLGQIASDFSTSVAPLLKACMSQEATYKGCGVKRIFPGLPSLEVFSTAGTGPGTIASDVLPLQVTGIISWRTAFAGRRYRGRSYIPFPAESDNQNSGVPSNNYVSTLLPPLRNDLIRARSPGAGPDFNDLLPVIFHRATLDNTTILSGLLPSKFATQRRRGSYGAPNAVPIGL